MGTDKAFLKHGGKIIIDIISELMLSLFKNVSIITNNPADYKHLNIQMYEDVIKKKGPLSGIHSGLFNSQTDFNFIISCDLPLMSREMIKYIVEYPSLKQVRYCYAGGNHHRLAGVYSRSILPAIEEIFSSNNLQTNNKERGFSIKSLFDNIESEILYPEGLRFYKPELFMNINTPEDYHSFLEIAGRNFNNE